MLLFLRGNVLPLRFGIPTEERRFSSARSLGKKPINYVSSGSSLYFCSELAPLSIKPRVRGKSIPTRSALFAAGLRSGIANHGQQIKKIAAAHYLIWRAGETKVQRYWSFSRLSKGSMQL
jgi:asparagine synthetase B (glutamine-hydrolysing)